MRRPNEVHEAVWARAKPPGMEYSVATRDDGGWTLRGTLDKRYGDYWVAI